MTDQSAQDDTVLLQIPYDRLRTDHSPPLVHLIEGIEHADISRFLNALSREEQAVHCIAVSCGLLYRYTGQVRTAFNLYCAAPPGGTAITGRFSITATGDTEFQKLLRNVAAELADGMAPPAANTPVSVTICRDMDVAQSSVSTNCAVGRSHSDLNLRFIESGGSWIVNVEYDGRVFDESTARRIQSHLHTLLLSCISQPSNRLMDLEIYTSADNAWFDTVVTGPHMPLPDTLAHREIERQAQLQPTREAVRFANSSLTYRDLNELANRLSHYLIAVGIRANCRVVVCVEPSFDIVVSLLAIFKSGGTYVPLSPSFPQHRIDTVINDTAPALIITQSGLLDRFSANSAITVAIDELPPKLAACSIENPDVPVAFDQNAYIYYTSGTTGKPKGARATYANLLHFTQVSRRAYGINACDVMPAIASFTFSISMFELVSPLVAGGTLVILERQQVLDAESMSRVLQQVTVAHIGPGLLKNIMRYISSTITDFSVFSSLRHISSGGDMVPPELLQHMQQVFRWSEIYVIYGCSEISLMGCTWRVDDKPAVVRTYVGRPFSNVSVESLDDDGNRVPVGAVGNVCFSGGGVVDGYLNRPDLTNKLFFQRQGKTFYNTGDRGKLSSGGDLELLGRRDFQVKIRGMRVELGEIEYHLRKAHGVREGVVAAMRRVGRDNVLIGYYVQETGSSTDSRIIRDYMLSRLPDYMVPSFFVELDALPLNMNLKVDRNALPDIDPASGLIEPPESETEKVLAEIWCKLLQIPRVGLGDNFLLLGGDSLLAMELILSVQQRLNVKLDGMDILRESLQVIAGICDRELHGPGPPVVSGKQATLHRGKIFRRSRSLYFGVNDELYGVYHSPVGSVAGNALLICPPLGQEYVRCHYLLKTVADTLAGQGMRVLRFDYYSTGDSLGDDLAGSPSRWQNDILEAYSLLLHESKSSGIVILGARLGASFALRTLTGMPVSGWVLWDPVISGRQHLEEQRRMHMQKENKLLVTRDLHKPRRRESSEELLGYNYSRAAIGQIEKLRLDPTDVPAKVPVHQIFSKTAPGFATLTDEWAAAQADDDITFLNEDCRWYDSTRLTSAITYKNLAMSLTDRIFGGER